MNKNIRFPHRLFPVNEARYVFKLKLPLCALLVALVLFMTSSQCTSLQSIADGSSSETVIGKITNVDGSPADSTTVMLIAHDYNPLATVASAPVFVDTTNAKGEYAIHAENLEGKYVIQAVHNTRRTRLMITAFDIQGDTTFARDGVLSVPGTIKIQLPDYFDRKNGYGYLLGTTIFANPVVNNAFLFLDSVPSGVALLVSYGVRGTGITKIIRNDVRVLPGDTAVIVQANSAYMRQLRLNTTASGANVSGTVYNFPVLIRLTTMNFTFSEAQENGSDLRFTKVDNAALPFEIERFDRAAGFAEIWVKVDTVFGSDSSHFIYMYWGDSSASTPSTMGSTGSSQGLGNSAFVFDTGNGFQGVWHLNEPSGTTVFDATVNGYNGTLFGQTGVSAGSGIIGSGYAFDGSSSYIAINAPDNASNKLNFPENGTYTISAWVNLDTLYSNQTEVIVEKGSQTPSEYVLSVNSKQMFSFMEYETAPQGWNYRYVPASVRAWTYVVGVKEGTKQYLYLDGVRVDSVGVFTSGSLLRGSGGSVAIGRNPYLNTPQNYLKGMIDEVCMANVARSADWIKLCAVNQQTEDKLVGY